MQTLERFPASCACYDHFLSAVAGYSHGHSLKFSMDPVVNKLHISTLVADVLVVCSRDLG